MITNSAYGRAGNDGLRHFRLVLLMASLGLAACVSDALPRDDDDDSGPRRDASVDARDADGGDGQRTDTPRMDAQDAAVTPDSQGMPDATADRPVIDVSVDMNVSDAADAADGRGADAIDASADAGSSDAGPDVTIADADAGGGTDAIDATTSDVTDAGTGIDATDAGGANDAGDASDANNTSDAADAGDSGGGIDANDAGSPIDAADVRDGAADGGDGGVVVFYREDFNSAIGGFTLDGTTCGANAPVWSNNGGYAHASEPVGTGASRIFSPNVTVPTDLSNIRLRMSHRYNTELGYDAAQLFVAVNNFPPIHVTTYVSGAYENGGVTNPNSCALGTASGQFPGWSGNRTEWVSEVNLAAAPFNVGPSDTVTIFFRMTVDPLMGGTGWDINWVTLSGTSP